MKIGIIGSGSIGATAARLFVAAGHKVALSNSRGPQTLQDTVKELGPQAQAVTVAEAAQYSEITLIAIPLGKYKSLPADAFTDKIVIDANNYYPQRDGQFSELDSDQTTSSEMLAAYLAGARIVKAFNTIYFEHLAQEGNMALPLAERRAIFVAGDDAEAKRAVADLITEIGFGPVDTGTLREGGRKQQPGTPVYNKDMTVQEAQAMLALR